MNRIAVLTFAAAFAATGATQAADLIVEAPYMPMVEAPAGNWDGFYAGIFAGYGMGEADHTNLAVHPDCAPSGCDVDMSGWLIGGTVGANFTVAESVVLGIAGDLAWSNIGGGDFFGAGIGDSSNMINWMGSLRGVLGFDGGAFMPYLTGGLAVANATHTLDNGAFDYTASATHIGWTGGVGVAIAATEDLVIDLQYRYSDFGEQPYEAGLGPNNPTFDLSAHTFTVGLNWQF